MTYGLPKGVIYRAVESGQLPAVKIITETGQERLYIAESDAKVWFSSLITGAPTRVVSGGE